MFKREGLGGIVRRAQILTGRIGHNSTLSHAAIYGPLPPHNPDFLPLVSVIVPNYNHAPYLSERLDCIYGQTYGNVQIILLDDCSTDESTSILSDYATRYPETTIRSFNCANSGGVFNQWRKGLELATGELIWIAESDDYCAANFVEELVRAFQNPAVMLAFSRSEFVRGKISEAVWSTKHYMSDLGLDIWDTSFVRSAHELVNSGWAVKNLIPNVSSALFRHPGQLGLFKDPEWLGLRLCGDWIFYLTIMRGGLVAYSPETINYYRQHETNTSTNAQLTDLYYQEHEAVLSRLTSLYRVNRAALDNQERHLYRHWCSQRGDDRKAEFANLYNPDRALNDNKRLPNVVMAVYALSAGGGETLPIMLANLLKERGYAVTLLNCSEQPTEPGVRSMLLPTIPLLQLDRLQLAAAALPNMGIEIVHSHHAWVDVSLATLLLAYPDIRQVVSMHGMYEMMTEAQLDGLMPVLRRRINQFVYTAEKNRTVFSADFQFEKGFRKISNALPAKPIQPITRAELGIPDNDFVLCCVARAIPEKGWRESIEAVKRVNLRSPRKVHLLLIGDGPEADELRLSHANAFVHFLGFKSNIRDYFAAADIGLLPSRFKGESAPLVLIDCLLAGKPLLASDIGEIRHMLDTENGPAGSLFTLKNWQIDVPVLGDLIHRLANDATFYEMLLARVPAASQRFETSVMVDKYEDTYRDAMRRSDAGSVQVEVQGART
ncbi:glycosyltransferase [Rhizobium sp. 2YAF20]|uniref:glycosyltransferase n=1 Tax=Rhizobium sp. 2YAF20 TaxID=3233027 RepID=UPI003F9897E2